MRVIRVQPCDDFNAAISNAAAAEQLGFGWAIIRSDRCPMVEKQQQTGDPPTDAEAEHHCPVHDHLAEYVVVLIEEPIPTGITALAVDAIEMILARDEVFDHDDVYHPDDTDDPNSGD